MAIYRENYTVIKEGIIKNKSLGLSERGLLLTLLSLPDGQPVSFENICSGLLDSVEEISKSLEVLKTLGYVKKDVATGDYIVRDFSEKVEG